MNHPEIPLDHHCSVIHFNDSGIWALEKSSGVLTHPNKESSKGRRPRTLLNAEYRHEEECYLWENKNGNAEKLYLVHRLDSPTSGVILASSCPEIADAIKTLFQNKEVRKTYFALVRPKGPIKEGFWKDHLKEKRENGKIRVSKGNGALAQTKVSVERKGGGLYGLALIRMEPRTGRTHQLRVQCAIRGISIIGDKSYGDFAFNRKIVRASKVDRLCLHAGEIEFKIKLGQKIIHFSADSPLPRAMGKLIL